MDKKIPLTSQKKQRIRKEFDNGIVVYNPTKEEEAQIVQFLKDNYNENTIEVSGEDILVHLLPICSNMYIDTENKELIQEIIEDPSEELEDVVLIIGEIVKRLSNKIARANEAIAELSPSDVAKLIGIEEIITEEEMAELTRLKEKAKKSGIK